MDNVMSVLAARRIQSSSDLFLYSPARVLSLHLGRRCLILCVARRIHQLLDIRNRRQLRLVLKECRLESPEWLLLVRNRVDLRRIAHSSRLICSCFNAFSRVDIRVDVKIPGGVNAYVVDLRGDQCVIRSSCLLSRLITLFNHTATKQLQKYGKRPMCRPS
jgi:hypothetical protein